MVSDTYVYVLADDMAFWVSDTDEYKDDLDQVLFGLTQKGVDVMYAALEAIRNNDPDLIKKNDRFYSKLSLDVLESITHKAVERL